MGPLSCTARSRYHSAADRSKRCPSTRFARSGQATLCISVRADHFSNTPVVGPDTVADMSLEAKVAVVTGATKGVGRGVGHELARHGARVFITGRSAPDYERLDEQITAVRCDHRLDSQVDAAFDLILGEVKAIDILVNSVWGGYEQMVENGAFTWPRPFWEQPLWRWDAMFSAGVRAYYHASQRAARSMIAQRRGLIVNISFWAAQKHIANVAYGVSKAATDKMTADMAAELKPHGVAVVSLYPGLVRTEKVMEAAQFLDLSNSESPEFTGRAVVALATDPDVLRHTGKVLVAAALAKEYGFTDIDGTTPRPLTLADV
jgi:dehydrogenase/reductase SDR family protein 1